MKRFLLVGLGIIFFMASLFLTGCYKKEPPMPERLKWVLIPAADADAELEVYRPIADYLETQIGMPIDLVVSSDYTTAIVSLKNGDAHLARLAPFSTALASTLMDVDPIVRGVQKGTGKAAYVALIVVKADSGIENLEGLKGKVFAYTDEVSTSGYLVPRAYFIENGIDPETYFSKTYLSGGHDASLLAVKNNKYRSFKYEKETI